MTPPDVKVCPACGGQGAYRDWFCPTCSRGEVVVSRALLERVREAVAGGLGTHGDPCQFGDDCDAVTTMRAALAELEGVLKTSKGDDDGL